ncbi:MAG: PEP-CTERM sorting domain-containing protein [Aquabacterium sp.]|nr:MAG: PEP-CTERM sorting domain-containing protein [Aquabacterium sp.]
MKAFLHSLICATSLICGEAHAGTMPIKLTLELSTEAQQAQSESSVSYARFTISDSYGFGKAPAVDVDATGIIFAYQHELYYVQVDGWQNQGLVVAGPSLAGPLLISGFIVDQATRTITSSLSRQASFVDSIPVWSYDSIERSYFPDAWVEADPAHLSPGSYELTIRGLRFTPEFRATLEEIGSWQGVEDFAPYMPQAYALFTGQTSLGSLKLQVTSVPEPSAMLSLGLGLAAAAAVSARRRGAG